ncbi:MAG: hypothetical protein ABSF54_01585 [Bryobacteraceae bacterium]|jgi:uncharacterized protein YjbJ (UPF0337 family)
MNWDEFEGKRKRSTGSVRERRGKLTNNNWETVAGKKDRSAGRIQEGYGGVGTAAQKQADDRALAQRGSGRESDAATRL